MGGTRRAQAQPASPAPEDRSAAAEVRCEACGACVPRLQSTRCASCGRTLCRLCVRWYGHFMLVCEDCRAGEW